MESSKTQQLTKTPNVHVGYERYAELAKIAIEVSYRTGKQITAAQFAQYLVDHYALLAAQKLMSKQGKQEQED
ncbi:hypothetical protein C5U62_31605 [Pseudomonas protegens]|uniref:Uncharacterized protein n=1 Tax=Pseudomonas protegens TaxID=380021 RepID=A0A2T6GBI3_9PSED|nr:hypothetical protein [Pseudomonas protegens]PUA41513.1 hypothetical protein C5U62_31605 [Pseudomonas protegens]